MVIVLINMLHLYVTVNKLKGDDAHVQNVCADAKSVCRMPPRVPSPLLMQERVNNMLLKVVSGTHFFTLLLA